MLMVGYLTYSGNKLVHDKFDVITTLWERIDTSPATENSRMQDSIARNRKITIAVDRVGGLLNADRLTYWGFSNGTFGVDGESWNYSNLMFQSVGDGIAPLEQSEKQNNTMIAEVMGDIFPTKDSTACKQYHPEDFDSSLLRESMKAVGSDVLYVCGLRNIKGHQVGRIQVSYRDRSKAPDETFVFDQLKALGSRIEIFKTEDNRTD
jgi:hypothetical protein